MSDVEKKELELEGQAEDFGALDLTKKKKKKKKKTLNLDLEETELQQDEEEVDFDLTKKKKKAKKQPLKLEEEGEEAPTDEKEGSEVYSYETMLTRIYHQLQELNPEKAVGEKRVLKCPPPQLARIGSKKTAFINFTTICNKLNRSPRHALQYFFAELGTSGSIDGTNQLIIKGRFQNKQIEKVLRDYMKEYVRCNSCKNFNTTMEKKERLNFLVCDDCLARRSVSAINTGFQAVTGKRARTRAKNEA